MTKEFYIIDKTEINPLICIFSLSGFSDYMMENAINCRLIDIDDMFSL